MKEEKSIGKKIKQAREAKNISLEELASRTELSVEKLSNIEKAVRLPSFWAGTKIAKALGVKPEDFFKEIEETGPIITRKDKRGKGANNSNHSDRPKKYMEYHALSDSKGGRHMEPFIIDVEQSANVDFVLSTHGGEEFIYVLNGCIDITYGSDMYHLEEGDSIYYDSIVEHQVCAGNNKKAKILAVAYLPV